MMFSSKKFRNEFKYYITYHEMIALRAKLIEYLSLDPYSLSEEGYSIRSLYFDSPFDHALYDKNEGVFNREKYRIRIYNESDAVIRLERKSKFGDFVCKEGASLSRDDYNSILNGQYHHLSSYEAPLIKDFYYALQHRHYKPITIVDYTREAYLYEMGNVRITFDKELRGCVNCLDLFDNRGIYESILAPELVILEIKFDQFLPDSIRKLIAPDNFVRSAISKYVLCREKNIQYFK
jgi:hypothetical protein